MSANNSEIEVLKDELSRLRQQITELAIAGVNHRPSEPTPEAYAINRLHGTYAAALFTILNGQK